MLGGRVDVVELGSQYTGNGEELGVDSRDRRSRGMSILGK
jgi:hypothetical protein